ncbi:MAG: discoidin domain-containing protein [Hominisplanchenecus sp.]|uniref:discoidin domain-containing protein n=1 Tax=Hominisplanchenecus sp. TaxID=3038130 RepID=UPI00399B3BA3
MKLKKILAQSLAVAMVLSSVPVANFTALAAEDTAAYASDDASTVDATADALPAPYGYKNLQLTVNENVEVTTADSPSTAKDTNILTNNDGAFLAINGNDSGTWINFHFHEAQTVAGCLYYLSKGQLNGYVRFAKVEVKTEGSDSYQNVYENVYENETAWEKENVTRAALFTPVSKVTDVKFYGISFNGIANYMQINKMRIVTVPENAALVTATASTSNEELGTVTVDVAEAKGKSNTVQVMKGVPVKYQATATEAGEFVEWRDASGKIVSNDAVYTTTAEEDTTLTAVFRDAYYEKIDQSILKANAKDNSHANVNNASTHDLPATAAFDGDESTLWHQNYNQSGGVGSKDKPSASNPIWIQTSFGTENEKNKVETVGCLTYRGRANGSTATRISDYVILAANRETGTPEPRDWAVVKAGTMSSNISAGNDVDTITFTPVRATHIRLVALSGYNSASFVCAGEINLYRVKDTSARVSELEDIETSAGIKNGTVTILPPGYETTNDASESAAADESASIIGKRLSGTTRNVTLYAAPNEGYVFNGWKKDNAVVSRSSFSLTNTYECANYIPTFTEQLSCSLISIQQDNVRANSAQGTSTGNDGPAWYAFDGIEAHHWHTKYNNTGSGEGGIPSSTNKLWIEAGFGSEKNIRKLTYRSRSDVVSCNAKDYEILAATTTKEQPSDSDFVVVCKGQFENNNEEQTVILPFTVKATHIRLRVSSVYDHNNSYLTASKITLWQEDDANDSDVSKVISVPSVSSNDINLGTVSTDKSLMLDKIDTAVTMTATPASGCHFVKWLITDAKGATTEKSTAVLNEVVNSKSQYSYVALFAKDAEVSVSLDQTYVTMTAGDSATQTLKAIVKNATNSTVDWTTDNPDVATVDDNGVITAGQRAGEATITATSKEDNTKSATCTVVVNAAPSTEALQALITEAANKGSDGKHYSKESSKKLSEELKIAQGLLTSTDFEAIAAEEAKLRTAMDNLVELYKVTIKSEEAALEDLILTAVDGDGEDEGSDTTGKEKWIYVPMFSRVKWQSKANANDANFSQVRYQLRFEGKVMVQARVIHSMLSKI